MTREQKTSALLQARADAYNAISDLLLTLDSHRNFHRRVEELVVKTNTIIRDITNAPITDSHGEQWPTCQQCKLRPATCIGHHILDGDMKICHECSEQLVKLGIVDVIEE